MTELQPVLLLVDDEKNILSALSRLLRPQGYTVHCAEGGEAGLAVLAREAVDLVISDMHMPNMDGVTFLSHVSERYPAVLSILLTANTHLSAAVEAINHGHVFKYINKPWDDAELLATLRQALQHKRLSDEHAQLLSLTRAQNAELQTLNLELDRKIRERDRLAERLNQELDLARQIQESLLPRQHNGDFPIIGANKPERHLSGDFYDYFTLPDGRIYFNLGDVSGKGTNAALLMAKTSSLFRCLGKRVHDPVQLLTQINQELVDTAVHGMFVTLVAGLYDPRGRHVTLVNAGHVPAVFIDADGRLEIFSAEAPPLGILDSSRYASIDISLGKGSLYVFSDGLIDSRLNGAPPLEMDGVIALIKQHHALPRAARLKAIMACFTGRQAYTRDDITLMLLED